MPLCFASAPWTFTKLPIPKFPAYLLGSWYVESMQADLLLNFTESHLNNELVGFRQLVQAS